MALFFIWAEPYCAPHSGFSLLLSSGTATMHPYLSEFLLLFCGAIDWIPTLKLVSPKISFFKGSKLVEKKAFKKLSRGRRRFRGLTYGFQHPHGCSQLAITLVPGNLVMFLTPAGTEHTCGCTYIHGGKPLMYINNFLKKNLYFYLFGFFMTAKGWGWFGR